MPVSACIVCFMFLYLHLYIYNFIKKRKSHFDPFLEQGQGCCCPLGALGATPEWVKFWEGWWPRKGVRCCVWAFPLTYAEAEASRWGLALWLTSMKLPCLHHPWQ